MKAMIQDTNPPTGDGRVKAMIQHTNPPTGDDRVKAMIQHTNPPSKFPAVFAGGNYDEAMEFKGMNVMCHRKGLHGDSISLHYSGFAKFLELCKSIVPTREVCEHALKIFTAMQKYHNNEEARRNKFNYLLGAYLGLFNANNTRCDGDTSPYLA